MFFELDTFAGDGIKGDIDGPVATARFNLPGWVAAAPSGDAVFVAETFWNGLRRIQGGNVSTLGGRAQGTVDGLLPAVSFSGPSGLACDRTGILYVADQGNHRIRKVDGDMVTTVAGPSGTDRPRGWIDDLLGEALFSRPTALALDPTDSLIYVAEHDRIRRLALQFQPSITSKSAVTIAGVGIKGFADGPAPVAQFNNPRGLAVTQTGDLLVADTSNLRIRVVTPDGLVTTLAGDGVPVDPDDASRFLDGQPALQARFERPWGLAIDAYGTVFIGDGSHVRMYSPIANTVSTACSDPGTHHNPIKFDGAKGLAIADGKILVVDGDKISRLTPHED